MSKVLLRLAVWAARKLYERVHGEHVGHVAFYCPGTPEQRAERMAQIIKENFPPRMETL